MGTARGRRGPRTLAAGLALHPLAKPAAASYAGVTGVGAALIGVAGSELRLPALEHLLRLPLRTIFLLNLLINVASISLGIALRLLLQGAPPGAVLFGGLLIAASLPGAYLGSRISLGTGERPLRATLLGLLVFVLGRLLAGDAPQGVPAIGSPWALPAVAAIGFATALVGGLVGVGGGQYRIPALVFLLGYGFKDAGTLSLSAAIATVLVAAMVHSWGIALDPSARAGLLWVGVPSVAAVVPGVLLLGGPEAYIRWAFAAVLAFIVASQAWDLFHPGLPRRPAPGGTLELRPPLRGLDGNPILGRVVDDPLGDSPAGRVGRRSAGDVPRHSPPRRLRADGGIGNLFSLRLPRQGRYTVSQQRTALQGHQPPEDRCMRKTYDTPGIEAIIERQRTEFPTWPSVSWNSKHLPSALLNFGLYSSFTLIRVKSYSR